MTTGADASGPAVGRLRWPRVRLLPRRARLATRVAVGSVLVAAVVAAVVATFLLATGTLRHASDRTARSQRVTVATLRLEKLVVDLETGLRGYVLSGRSAVLGPWRDARSQLPAAEATLTSLVRGDRTQEERTRAISRAIDSYVTDYALPLVAIVGYAPEAARSPVATLEGKRRTDEIRRLFDRLLATEGARTTHSAAAASDASTLALAIGIAALAVSALLVLLFGVYLARSIVRPVRAVADGASRLAGGDLSTRLAVSGPGEIAELEQAFNAMAASLQRSRRELEEQNERLRESERAKSELISIVSHEVRTPLTSVLGFTRVLRSRSVDDATRDHYLEIIDDQGRRLGKLLEDFLDAQQMEEHGLALELERVDLAALLREQVRLFAGQSATHAIELSAEPGLAVVADPNRLAQVVANLLSNAIKYSPGGSAVQVAATRGPASARIEVRDRGRGIPEELQPQIFTKFFRGDAAATGIPGTGLGLAVARDIVEAHGGLLDFASEPGKGSTFWIELPLAAEEAGS